MNKLILLLALSISNLFSADGATLFQKCSPCHGIKAEKSLENKYEAIASWDAIKIEKAIRGYKDGSRKDKGMGALMRGKVANLSDADIKAVSAYIANIK